MRQTHARVALPEVGRRDGFTWLTYGELTRPGLTHGIVVFKDTPFDRDRDRWRLEAAAFLRSRLEVSPQRVVIPTQIHSSEVRRISEIGDEQSVVCDGLVTDQPRVMLGVSVADCIPLFAVNLRDRTIGIAHCGWRGIAGGMVEEFQSVLKATVEHPRTTRYLIGASIDVCCYEVREDMLAHFSGKDVRDHVKKGEQRQRGQVDALTILGSRSYPRWSMRRLDPFSSFFHFDLKGLVASKLAEQGVQAHQIYVDRTCTSCQKYVLSSYRGSGRDCGRMLAFVMLTK